MLMFIRLEIEDDRIVSVEAMRVMVGWKVAAGYTTKVGEQLRIEAAIRPIGMMLMRSDIVIFSTQEERDLFMKVAKRWLDKPVLSRSRIIPKDMIGIRPKNIQMLIKELRNTGLSVEELARQVIE